MGSSFLVKHSGPVKKSNIELIHHRRVLSGRIGTRHTHYRHDADRQVGSAGPRFDSASVDSHPGQITSQHNTLPPKGNLKRMGGAVRYHAEEVGRLGLVTKSREISFGTFCMVYRPFLQICPMDHVSNFMTNFCPLFWYILSLVQSYSWCCTVCSPGDASNPLAPERHVRVMSDLLQRCSLSHFAAHQYQLNTVVPPLSPPHSPASTC